MRQSKPFYASKVLWTNVLTLAVVAIGGVLDVAGVLELSARDVALVTVALAVANAALRIFATSQPLSLKP